MVEHSAWSEYSIEHSARTKCSISKITEYVKMVEFWMVEHSARSECSIGRLAQSECSIEQPGLNVRHRKTSIEH